jgi:hypothetical protein
MKNKMKFLTILFSVLILFSCKEKEDYSKIKNSKVAAKVTTHKIVIDEFLDAGGYTYLNADENGTKYWIAIPTTAVKVGETYYYDGGMTMKKFESKQLERTFDEIIFADGIRTNEVVKTTPKKLNPHENSDVSSVDDVKIDKPKDGISIEDLLKNKKSFSEKSVIVRGKVVKVNKNIMDRNWVHIIDGTKFKDKKSLTITTQELVKVGDTITIKGTVALDKEFGKGYVYPVLLEKGELIK